MAVGDTSFPYKTDRRNCTQYIDNPQKISIRVSHLLSCIFFVDDLLP